MAYNLLSPVVSLFSDVDLVKGELRRNVFVKSRAKSVLNRLLFSDYDATYDYDLNYDTCKFCVFPISGF